MAKELIDQINLKSKESKQDVVYGVYDNRSQGVFTRIDDFFIDHSKISIKEKSYFYHLLAVMINSGLPLLKALKTLVDRTENPHLSRIINTIAHNTENKGHTLAQSMQKFPDTFEESEIGIIKSGEETGKLDSMLFKLSKQQTEAYELKLKIKSALIYPLTVISALVIAIAIVIIFVIPKLKSFFSENNIDLPLPTEILIGVGNFFSQYIWLIIIAIAVSILIFNFYINTENGRFKWHYYLLKMPLIGNMLIKISIVKFVRLLEVLVQSGLPITKVLKITADSIGNDVYKRKLYDTANHVEQGEKISDQLSTASLIFPLTLVEMLRIGENTASLDVSCEKMAEHFEKEIEHDLKNTIAILEPAMIVIIGLFITMLAFAIMGPIFKLSSIS